MKDQSALLDKKQVARSLTICIRSLEGLMRARLISFVKIGRSVRFEREAIEEFITAQTVKSTTP